MKQKILITGTCGFLMGNLIRKAIYEKLPYQFVSLDRVRSSSINSMYWNKSHTFHIADIRDKHIIDIIFQIEKPDIVIHGAEEFIDYEDNNIYSSNVLGTSVLVDACIKHKVKNMIYISTNSRNVDSYVNSKLQAEKIIKSKQDELNFNIVKCSHNYGPRQNINKQIPSIINNILNNKPIYINGNGLNTKEWTHAFDTCSAIFNLLERAGNNVYDVSSKEELSDLDLTQKICHFMGCGYDLISFKKVNVEQKSENSEVILDIRELGWEPKIKIKDGLWSQCIFWFLNNKWVFK